MHFRQVTLKFVCPWHFPLAQVFKLPKPQIENLKPFTGVLADYDGLFARCHAPFSNLFFYSFLLLHSSIVSELRSIVLVVCLLSTQPILSVVTRGAWRLLFAAVLELNTIACYFLNYAPMILVFITKPLNQCFQ